MTAQDDAWPVYFETISFDSSGGFNAEITNGDDNPSGSGNYYYSKTGENVAELTYSVEGGFPSFKYYLTFSSEMSGTYRKEADYGTSLDFTSGPFSITGGSYPGTGGDNGGVEAPESLSGLEVDIHYSELMSNGAYEDLGVESVSFGPTEVGSFDDDTQQMEYEIYSYTKTSGTTAQIYLGTAGGNDTGEVFLTFTEPGYAEGTWIEVDEGETFEGKLTFRIMTGSQDTTGTDPNSPGTNPGTGGSDPGTGDNMPDPISIPVDEVEEFVDSFIQSRVDLGGARAIWAEKLIDAIKSEERYVYIVGLDVGHSLIFDQNKNFLHAIPSDEFAYFEREFLSPEDLPEKIHSVIMEELPNAVVVEVEKEFSVLQSDTPSFVYNVFVDFNDLEYALHFTSDHQLVLIVLDDDDGFEDEWRPVELPDSAKIYISENYPYLVEGLNLFVEERPTPNGQETEIVAYIDDGSELIFNTDGDFLREFNPWKDFEQNLDAGLVFDSTKSSPLGSVAVHIAKVQNENEYGSLLYRISLTNSELSSESVVSNSDLDISDFFSEDSQISLTFTYDMGPPRYFVVSGSNVSAFKHTLGDWDESSSFTIKAQPVVPVASPSNSNGGVGLTFSMLVEMGGERNYEGSIFEANVIGLDLGPAEYSLPWDPVASFSINGLDGVDTAVSAYLPRRLLSGYYGIMDPQDVKAALISESGALSYVNGSLRDSPEEGASLVGSFFNRTPFKGHEPKFEESGPYPSMTADPGLQAFEFDDSIFDLHEPDTSNENVEPDQSEGEQIEQGDIDASKFDFDGDGLANSLLKVSFSANSFPAEVQFGDPWVDPYANLDDTSFGTISGSILNADGEPIPEFDVWFFKATEAGQDLYSGEPVFFDLQHGENGTFTAKLPAGSYHAEAVGYDFLNDVPYQPQIAGGFENPTVFEIVDSSTVISEVNFLLAAEFRVSNIFAEVEGSVEISGDIDSPIDVFFDLYPVDATTGERLTNYPVHSYGLTRSGEIKTHAPVGTFDIELFSPDNSLSLASPLEDITIEEGLNDLGVILLNARELITVNGVITDAATDSGIWADVVFVDPENPEVQFWPMWNPASVEPAPGSYSVLIPEGSYLIKAERFDGLYQPAFYDSNNDGDADVVDVSSGFSQSIDIALTSKPTATVTITLLDKNTSEPVKYAWFDFFDAEDEFAPIVFPQLDGTDFESDFDGTYTLKVPGGNYKVAVGGHAYEGVMRTLDESGQPVWENAGWENAASINLVDGETSDLGSIQMQAFELSEAELFGFNWIDEGMELSGSTISGFVKTTDGTAVPKARIIAHTVDYLFWFDHIQSRSDGSFELTNMPDGEWLIFAEPPFDSENFQGFRESDQKEVSLPSENDGSIDLTLQGSNVFGRVVFPKKNRDSGETKNNGLAHAFVWAYTDEDQDGEPDWDSEILAGTATLTEAFGETDQNGYFSFYLEEAGKYSLRIDIPGQMSSLAPAPIGFTLKNPNDSVKLGNAVKIDWKAELKASAFDVQRKSSTSSTYVSLFAGENNTSKPSANAKSYVDATAKPGASYSYRVVAETANGQVNLDADQVRTSEPFIYLAPASKTITGRVLDASSNPIANAEVVAWRQEGEGWSSAFSADDGSYELIAGPGKWEVTVYRPFDVMVDWFYEAAPKRVKFKNDSSKESESKNFTVSKMAGGKITGTIALPTNVSYTELSNYVFIDAFDPEGRGNWAQPDSQGVFEIPLQPGQYELSLWIDPALQGFGSPEIKFVRVGKETVDVGELQLSSRDKSITGSISTSAGKALPNVEVWAWSEQGGWVSDTTNISGEYILAVSPGRWEVGFELPIPEDGSESPYIPSPPKRLRFKDSDNSKVLNFSVREAGARVSGVVYGADGNPVSDLDAWVYAKEYSADEGVEFYDIVADVPLTSKGTFSFPGLPGEYLVGLWLPPGSDYGHPDEKYYQIVVENGQTTLLDASGVSVEQARFDLSANDSIVTGTFKFNGQAVSGLVGEVHAMKVDGEGWQSTSIEDNGTYSFLLSSGSWAIDYYIESDSLSRNFPAYSAKPVVVYAEQSATTTQDLTLSSASATVSGTVFYEESGLAVKDSSLFVWAYREGSEFRDEYWNEVETDENGTFSIPVLPGGKYEIGAFLSQELREADYLDARAITANLSSGSVADLNLTIGKPSDQNFISGNVVDENGNALEEAYVYAWADDGREVYGQTDSNGAFNILVPNGSVWHVGGEYSLIDDSGTESFLSTKFEKDVDLTNIASKSNLSLILKAPDFEIPDGNSQTFDPNVDFVTKLPDGTELTIPGGASNVSSDVDSVRIVITPTAKGLSKSANEKPANYGYSVELFDNNGKKVEGNFKKDVILSIPVDVNASKANGMNIQNIEAMYYSTIKDAWDKAKTSTWDQNSSTLTMTTDHFTTFAAVSTPDISDLASGLAKVDSETSGDWFTLDWFGYFYDATSGWVYHTKLGWLYVTEDSNGNFWFYESTVGWLWTGPTYYNEADSKSFFYSSTEASWLHFEIIEGEGRFYDYSDEQWITTD